MNFVAISLMVTLELIKFFQAYFIQEDWRMFDQEKGMAASVQTSNLNEELGMVHYIFSDKTGTLTQNVMEFKMFSAGPHNYGEKDPKPKQYPSGVTNVNFACKTFDQHFSNHGHENYDNIVTMLEALGVCHTVIAEPKVDKEGKNYIAYNASSPDELALVNGARSLGFAFRERDEEGDVVIDFKPPGSTKTEVLKYKLLNLIEFDSARKRMTVVVRAPNGKLLVLCKGADSIIEKRLKSNQKHLFDTKQFLKAYANDGLRTLMIARKEISEEFYSAWDKKYQRAVVSVDKEKLLAKVAEELEHDFELVGSTAIEDKLQDDVGTTIHDLKRAGIKVWVLTGDKVETAINIGYSCRLLNKHMNIFIMHEVKPKRIRVELANLLAQ
jgi:phospholipid-translocating P-type ATPase (flippase)